MVTYDVFSPHTRMFLEYNFLSTRFFACLFSLLVCFHWRLDCNRAICVQGTPHKFIAFVKKNKTKKTSIFFFSSLHSYLRICKYKKKNCLYYLLVIIMVMKNGDDLTEEEIKLWWKTFGWDEDTYLSLALCNGIRRLFGVQASVDIIYPIFIASTHSFEPKRVLARNRTFYLIRIFSGRNARTTAAFAFLSIYRCSFR